MKLYSEIDYIAYQSYLKTNKSNFTPMSIHSYVYVKLHKESYYDFYINDIISNNYIIANNILRKLKLEKIESDNR